MFRKRLIIKGASHSNHYNMQECTTVFQFGVKIFSFAEFLEVNFQHSVCVRIPFPFIAYTRDDLCRKLETIFNHSVKGAE